MCRVRNWNCSQECLTSAEALDALLELRTTNPTLHAALNQGDDNIGQFANIEEKPFQDTKVYDDCDIPLDVVSDLLISGGSAIGTNFSVDENGGITRSGSAEDVDAESESESEVQSVAPAILGRGQRKKIVAKRYQGPIWEEH
ncbi:hypothetical protein K438DRAFT_1781135 [Mycena galopus ATCC 62051]|nr:hypothetical protein K438DRAFT_1781135 [Mycena galopus ATCC 62051]